MLVYLNEYHCFCCYSQLRVGSSQRVSLFLLLQSAACWFISTSIIVSVATVSCVLVHLNEYHCFCCYSQLRVGLSQRVSLFLLLQSAVCWFISTSIIVSVATVSCVLVYLNEYHCFCCYSQLRVSLSQRVSLFLLLQSAACWFISTSIIVSVATVSCVLVYLNEYHYFCCYSQLCVGLSQRVSCGVSSVHSARRHTAMGRPHNTRSGWSLLSAAMQCNREK